MILIITGILLLNLLVLPVQFVNHGLFTMTTHYHLLLFQLLGNILSRGSRDIDPCLGEECTRAQHKYNVEKSMDRVFCNLSQRFRRREIITQSSNWERWWSTSFVPYSEKSDKKVVCKFSRQQLGDKVDIGDQSTLTVNVFLNLLIRVMLICLNTLFISLLIEFHFY